MNVSFCTWTQLSKARSRQAPELSLCLANGSATRRTHFWQDLITPRSFKSVSSASRTWQHGDMVAATPRFNPMATTAVFFMLCILFTRSKIVCLTSHKLICLYFANNCLLPLYITLYPHYNPLLQPVTLLLLSLHQVYLRLQHSLFITLFNSVPPPLMSLLLHILRNPIVPWIYLNPSHPQTLPLFHTFMCQ